MDPVVEVPEGDGLADGDGLELEVGDGEGDGLDEGDGEGLDVGDGAGWRSTKTDTLATAELPA